jgi:hypothetical protein
MRIRLHISERKTVEAERDWLLGEVNKGLVPGHRGLKLLLVLIVSLIVIAAVITLLPRVRPG